MSIVVTPHIHENHSVITNKFNPAYPLNCLTCVHSYCASAPFASYDASGILMEYVVAGSSLVYTYPYGYIWNTYGTYKQAESDPPIPSVEPFFNGATACCYEATLTGFDNNSTSWCQQNDRLNGIYEMLPSLIPSVYTTTSGNQNVGYMANLCKVQDSSTYYMEANASGLALINTNLFSPCNITNSIFYVNVEEVVDDEPDIVAYFWLIYYPLAYIEWSFNFTSYPNIAIAPPAPLCGWRKVLGKYDGDYIKYKAGQYQADMEFGWWGDNYVSPFRSYISGNRGTFDGRSLDITFDSSNVITNILPFSGVLFNPGYYFLHYTSALVNPAYYYPDVLGYTNATINIKSKEDVGEDNNCGDKNVVSNLFSTCQLEMLALSGTIYEYYYGSRYKEIVTIAPAPNVILVTVSGVTGIDDNLDETELLSITGCKKCNNLNNVWSLSYRPTSYDYKASDIPSVNHVDQFDNAAGVWSLNKPYLAEYLPVNMCCDCPGSSICIDNIKFYLVQTSGYDDYAFIDTYARLDFYDANHYGTVVARLEKHLDISLSTAPRYKISCDTNIIDSIVFASSILPADQPWQRCDFTNAVAKIEFPSITNNNIPCFFPERYQCLLCADGYSPNIVASIQGFTHNGEVNPCPHPDFRISPYCPYDCISWDGSYLLDLVEGSYAFDASGNYTANGCAWRYVSDDEFYIATGGICDYYPWYYEIGCYLHLNLYISNIVDDDSKIRVTLALNGAGWRDWYFQDSMLIAWETTVDAYNNTPIYKFGYHEGYPGYTYLINTRRPFIFPTQLNGLELPCVYQRIPTSDRCWGWIAYCEDTTYKEWSFDGSSATLSII